MEKNEPNVKISLKIVTVSLLRQTPYLRSLGVPALTSGKRSFDAAGAFYLRQKLQPPGATATLPVAACDSTVSAHGV